MCCSKGLFANFKLRSAEMGPAIKLYQRMAFASAPLPPPSFAHLLVHTLPYLVQSYSLSASESGSFEAQAHFRSC